MKESYFTSSNIAERSAGIKKNAQRYSGRKTFVFRPETSALLVLDMQEYFLSAGSPAFVPSATAILPNIQQLIGFFQSNDLPVLYTRHVNNNSDAVMMNTWWSRLISKENPLSRLVFKSAETVIDKSQYDAFYDTNLKALLQRKKQIIICGVMTHLCCETTLRSAFVRGFETLMPVDATATYTLELHQSTFNNLSHGFCPPLLTKELLKQSGT